MSETERIAVLEQQNVEAARQRGDIQHRLDSQDEALESIKRDVHDIKITISKYQGFFGGVVFVITSIGAVLGAVLMALWKKFT